MKHTPEYALLCDEYLRRAQSVSEFSHDIWQHLPTLAHLAIECAHVTEFGVRTGNSSSAFLVGLCERPGGGTLIGYDVEPRETGLPALPPPILHRVFRQNTITPGFLIEPTDLLFVDSCHDYLHVLHELTMHEKQVRKFIVMHDVSPFWTGAGGSRGPLKAMIELLASSPFWELTHFHTHCNGLAILKRKP